MHRDIEILVVDDDIVFPQPILLDQGDTVSYFSKAGKVRIVFDLPNSNGQDVVNDGQKLTAVRPGKFFGKCFVTKPDGTTIDWSADKPKAGGDHDVKP